MFSKASKIFKSEINKQKDLRRWSISSKQHFLIIFIFLCFLSNNFTCLYKGIYFSWYTKILFILNVSYEIRFQDFKKNAIVELESQTLSMNFYYLSISWSKHRRNIIWHPLYVELKRKKLYKYEFSYKTATDSQS